MKKLWAVTTIVMHATVALAEDEKGAEAVAMKSHRLAGLPESALREISTWKVTSVEDLPDGLTVEDLCWDEEGHPLPIEALMPPKSVNLQVKVTDSQLNEIRKALNAMGVTWVE